MKKMILKSVHDKAVRLVEGGHVEVDGLTVRAIKVPIHYSPCAICEMDSLCYKSEVSEMAYVCKEVDYYRKGRYYLKFVNRR